jgi:hypothetical protein
VKGTQSLEREDCCVGMLFGILVHDSCEVGLIFESSRVLFCFACKTVSSRILICNACKQAFQRIFPYLYLFGILHTQLHLFIFSLCLWECDRGC